MTPSLSGVKYLDSGSLCPILQCPPQLTDCPEHIKFTEIQDNEMQKICTLQKLTECRAFLQEKRREKKKRNRTVSLKSNGNVDFGVV